MKTHHIGLSAVLLSISLAGVLGTATGCAGSRDQRSTGAYMDDTALGAKVKTALFKDPQVSGFDVTVNTYRGEVQLSGFVDNPEQKDRAAEIVRNVPGVQVVVNNLQIKPAPTEAVGTPGSAVPGTTRTVVQPPPPRPEPNPPPPVRDAEDRVTVRPETLAGLPTGVRDLEISTSNGKATIRGKAPTEADKMEVERHVLQIPGVQSVDNKIEVRPPAPVRQ